MRDDKSCHECNGSETAAEMADDWTSPCNIRKHMRERIAGTRARFSRASCWEMVVCILFSDFVRPSHALSGGNGGLYLPRKDVMYNGRQYCQSRLSEIL
jgi:hypothetical protein